MTIKKKLVLVPVDFSKVSLDALDMAASIAHKVDAEILMLHVVETYDLNVDLGESVVKVLDAKIKDKLEKIRTDNQNLWGLNIMAVHKKGKIHEVIREVADEREAWLIVMGTTGVSGLSSLSRFFLGSNAHRTVQLSNHPVLTVREGKYNADFKNIILPLDVEHDTTQKVDFALKWAKFFKSTVHVVSVTSELEYASGDDKEVDEKLKQVADRFDDEGVKVKIASIHEKNVAEALVSYADRIKADLTIIMTRQESKINDVLIGSRARSIITKSNRPVLSLRPGQAKEFSPK